MWLSAIGGKLHIAPLPDNIHEVLDVGTGTGVWAIDFADTHPSAEVTGTDISPIQPRLVPPNCRFIVDNSEDEWQWQNKFDFIHSRALASSWQDWESYFHKCYQALKPGGYLEVQEYMLPFEIDIPTPTVPTPSYAPSSTTPPNPVLEWSNYFAEACRLADVGLDQVPQLDILLQNAGFTSVTRKMVRQPINGWSEDPDERARGELYAQCFDYGLGVTMFTRRLGWSYAQAEVFLVDVRKAAKDEGNRVWVPFFFYTAKKPE
jgi:SAM-dependent methyltransferase